MINYENARERIELIPVSPEPDSRNVEWITAAEIIGVARDTEGKVELLLRGAELVPVSKTVRDASEHRSIYKDDGTSFEATRLVFPAVAHFDQVAAFICIELLRNGADSDLPRAFVRTEPIIELAIQNLTLSNEALLGLAGELLLLDALCHRVQDARVREITGGWHGWRRSARDFVVGNTGVEVKTTTGDTSSHLVEGVHQVERDDEGDERQFLLVSVGLQRAWSESNNSFTVPGLVDRILKRMDDARVPDSVIGRFVTRVAEYGANSWIGYDHTTQAADPTYLIPFLTTFVRAYDMDDAAIGVLRRRDVSSFRHVVGDSLRFRVNLSTNGPISAGNPVEGTNRVALKILGV